MLDYGIVGNCKTCALIKKDASVDWMCLPTFSSPSVFGRLLDKKGGTLRVRPVGKYKVTQRYIEDTAVLETTFRSERASFQVIDFFPRYRRLLRSKEHLFKQNKLVRIIKRLKGKPRLRVEYDPKPDYARPEPETREEKGQLITERDGHKASVISNIPHETLTKGEAFELVQTRYLVIGEPADQADYSVKRCVRLLNATKRYWTDWVSTLVVPERNRDIIVRSAITLKLLTYSKTGAILAAATTSIPEEVGTERAYDYRFCWVRDAAFAVDALKKIGREYEPRKLLEFVLEQVLKNDFVQIMYGINGETRLREQALDHLEGYKASSPVKVGNPAYNQVQHDIYGEIIDVMYLYFGYYGYGKMTRKYWRFLTWLVNQIKFVWERADSGIWEFRGILRHYTYSKFMCYVGVDRAIKLAQQHERHNLVEEWLDLREEIREDVCRNGYNHDVPAFTMHYESKDLDAAVLQMSYHEFLPPDDPRIISTVKAIYEGLRHDYLVQRYTIHDDFGKSQSAFTICSFWLVDALWYIGEREKAERIYRRLLKHANHLGLFSEDIDLATKRLVGNFPQAYTHIALINSSILLSEWSAKRKKIDWSAPRKKQWF